MKTEKDDLTHKDEMPKARSDERTITHETIPGQKPPTDQDKEKASTSTMDEDLN